MEWLCSTQSPISHLIWTQPHKPRVNPTTSFGRDVVIAGPQLFREPLKNPLLAPSDFSEGIVLRTARSSAPSLDVTVVIYNLSSMASQPHQKEVPHNNHVDYVIRYSFYDTGMFAALRRRQPD